jgi:N-acetylmuramoyl-L-alanine amidase
MIKGDDIFTDTPGIIVNDRALVPIAAIFGELGIPFEWLGETEQVKFTVGGKTVLMQIDNPYALVDGVKTLLPDGVAPRIFSYNGIGRTYVPVRFVVEMLDMSVAWLGDTRTVAINSKEQTLTNAELNYKGQYPEIRFKTTGEVNATSYVISGADVGGQDLVVVDIQNTKLDISTSDKNWTKSGDTWIYDIYDGIFGLDKVEISQTATNPYTTRVILYQNERRGHDLSYDSRSGEFVLRLINTVNDVHVEKIYSTDTVVIKTSENPMVNSTLQGNKIIVDVIGSYMHINEGLREMMAVNEGKIKSVTYEQVKDSNYGTFDDVTRVTIELFEEATYDNHYVDTESSQILVYVTNNLINNFDYVKKSNEEARLDVRLFGDTDYTYDFNPALNQIKVTLPKTSTDLGSFEYPVNDNIIEWIDVVETDLNYEVIVQVGKDTVSSNFSSKDLVSLRFVNTKIKNSEFRETLIVIDAGHGGRDPGAIGSMIQEKDVNLKTALKLQKELEKQGFKVYMTRSKDEYVNLYDRAGMANGLGATLFVSIHANASASGSANGVEVLYSNDSMSGGKGLATEIQNEMVRTLRATDRGVVKRTNLVVLRETVMPAVLVELGFLTNAAEQNKLMNDGYLQSSAEAIARGIMEFLK